GIRRANVERAHLDLALELCTRRRPPPAFGTNAIPHLSIGRPQLLPCLRVRLRDMPGRVNPNRQLCCTTLRECLVVKVHVRPEPPRAATDDREHHAHSMARGTGHRFRAPSNTNPRDQIAAFRWREDSLPCQGRTQLALPGYRRSLSIGFKYLGKQRELLLEQLFVLVERIAEKRKRLDERAATENDLRASAGDCIQC